MLLIPPSTNRHPSEFTQIFNMGIQIVVPPLCGHTVTTPWSGQAGKAVFELGCDEALFTLLTTILTA